jgi:adenylate cyclase
MAREIERKFLLCNPHWREAVTRSSPMRQGYLVSDQTRSVRVRISGEHAQLNIKSAVVGIERAEYEYAIPLDEAAEMLDKLCEKPLLEKTRHLLPIGPHTWEIDEFAGDNAGLVVAEIELSDPDEHFARPDWLGEEVTHELRYYNVMLARNPFRNW